MKIVRKIKVFATRHVNSDVQYGIFFIKVSAYEVDRIKNKIVTRATTYFRSLGADNFPEPVVGWKMEWTASSSSEYSTFAWGYGKSTRESDIFNFLTKSIYLSVKLWCLNSEYFLMIFGCITVSMYKKYKMNRLILLWNTNSSTPFTRKTWSHRFRLNISAMVERWP